MINSQNFLELNYKKVWFIVKNGIVFIAVKPICEALKVNFQEQHKNIISDQILGPASCVHTIQIPNDQGRKYFCLPEQYIYGWVFSLRPINPSTEFFEYKKKCYDILYNHFHGAITGLKSILSQQKEIQEETEAISETLRQTAPEFKRLEILKGKQLRLGKNLKQELDDIANGQLKMEFT